MDLNKLKALAAAATAGPWEFDTADTPYRIAGGEVVGGDALPYGDVYTTDDWETPEGPEPLIITTEIGVDNGRYIAAANPSTVLELIALIERIQAELTAERAAKAQGALTDDKIWHICRYQTPVIFNTIMSGDVFKFARAILAAQPAPSAAPIPAQPVAYAVFAENGNVRIWFGTHAAAMKWAVSNAINQDCLTPLYIAPQAAAAPDAQPATEIPCATCKCAHIGECDGSCAPYIAAAQPEAKAAQLDAANGMPPMDMVSRMTRLGKHVMEFATKGGWQDDGEGAFEFIQRQSYAVGISDAGKTPPSGPRWGNRWPIDQLESVGTSQDQSRSRAALEAARNAAYPVPDSPHASVNMRAVADRTAFTRGWDAATTANQAAPAVAALSDEQRALVRSIFMAHGFTIKEDQTDLKPYVYDAARALLAAAGNSQGQAAQPEQQPVGEVVLFGNDCKEISWAKGKMPPVGAKLYIAPVPAAAPEPLQGCKWAYDEPEYSWDSACGEKWSFVDGGPEENRVRFCHGCGKPVVLAAAPVGGA